MAVKNVTPASWGSVLPSQDGMYYSAYPDGDAPPQDAWLLPEGHFVPSKAEPVITHPRPDDETYPWERHRLTPSGRKWQIPIAVHSGSWPFHFSVDSLSASKGISIGQQLIVDGDVLVVPEDYAVLSWNNPTIGAHVITVTCTTQERGRNTSGFADELTRTFTLDVKDREDTDYFIWLSGAGDDETGDGSYSNPLRSLWSVFGSSDHGGKQLHLMTGVFDTDGDGQFALGGTTPAVIVGDVDSAPEINYTQRNFGGRSPGIWLSDIETSEGGYGLISSNERLVALGNGNESRFTAFRCDFVDPGNGTSGNDNPTAIFSSGGGAGRDYITVVRCSDSGRGITGNSGSIFILYAADYVVSEFNRVPRGGGDYNLLLKDSNRNCTQRANVITADSGQYGLATLCQAQSYKSENIEISYNKSNLPMRLNGANNTVEGTGVHYVFRNSLGASLSVLSNDLEITGPYYIENNAIEGSVASGGRVIVSGGECHSSTALDPDLNLTGSFRSDYLGTRAAEVSK